LRIRERMIYFAVIFTNLLKVLLILFCPMSNLDYMCSYIGPLYYGPLSNYMLKLVQLDGLARQELGYIGISCSIAATF
jgi:hypothetical protein